MNTQIISTAINEQIFLKRNSLLGIFVGLMFISSPLYKLLEPFITLYDWLYITLGLLSIVLGISIVFTLFKTIKSMGNMDRYTIWYSHFNDEYFNHINNKGFKYSFNTSCAFLVFFSVFGHHFQSFLVNLSFSDFAEFTLGLSFISYSLPILLLLRGEDE
ncbi:hypothetical protein FGD67_00460 [Colwellia sp. M166]|uniref:hypothetical protein n=1 Tax=Colwellia sp. M166 TaxID=2583805 RepID=UPI00211F46CE|nr:hypothetical protein [Colwellia sp. M166]UUO21835.1 hypothetical protein FGD67_00460 [Colwellia sp. M166]|tara:strand:+ start:198 stop:677 length:480 start_codon:yes stop_codon:yes gene_type:complete